MSNRADAQRRSLSRLVALCLRHGGQRHCRFVARLVQIGEKDLIVRDAPPIVVQILLQLDLFVDEEAGNDGDGGEDEQRDQDGGPDWKYFCKGIKCPI